MRLLLALLLFGLIAPASVGTPALAQTFPPLTGRVVDAANMLPPEVEAEITARSLALEQSTTAQVVVATVPDLEGYEIADYGYRLGRAWGIGQKDKNNGVILLVAPNNKKVRIEVGYGLEPVLTDALSSVIVNQQVLPRFRAGDMPGGVKAGADAIMQQLELPPAEAAANVQKAAATAQSGGDGGGGGFGTFLFIAFILLWLFFAMRRGKRGTRRSGTPPIIIWGPGPGGGGWGGGGGGFGGGGGGGGFGGGGGGFGGGGSSGGW